MEFPIDSNEYLFTGNFIFGRYAIQLTDHLYNHSLLLIIKYNDDEKTQYQ